MLSSAPIAQSAAAAIAAIPAMSSASTGCSKNVSPLPATVRAYCIACSALQPWLASDEISRSGPSSSQTRRVRSPSMSGVSMPTLILKARKPSAFLLPASRRSAASSPLLMTPSSAMRLLRLPPSSAWAGRLVARPTRSCSAISIAALAALLPYMRPAIAASAPAMSSAGRPISAGAR